MGILLAGTYSHILNHHSILAQGEVLKELLLGLQRPLAVSYTHTYIYYILLTKGNVTFRYQW